MGLEHFVAGTMAWPNIIFATQSKKTPRDATAWVGLAASYDEIGRFDLADRSYAEAIKLIGETTQILNNLGYSYM